MRAFRPASRLVSLIFAALAGLLVAGVPGSAQAQAAGGIITTPSGLQIADIQVGTGSIPRQGQICVMHYTGWL